MAKKERITSDERFKAVHNDPRFRMPKRNDFKVEIDDRFKNSDLVSIKKKSKLDKYGRKREDKHDTFDKYFKKSDKKDSKKKAEPESDDEEEETGEEDKSEDEEESSEEEEEDEDDDDDEVEEEEDTVVSKLDRARGEKADDASSSDESSSDESSSDEESEDEEEEDEEEDDDKPEEMDPSTRIAVVNLDWDHVKSVDLLATFQSFVPTDGLIENISIYPSEFGKERMQKEDIEGPPRDVFKKKSKKSKNEESDDDSDSEIEAKDLYEEGDGTEDYDAKSLRRYQLQRLRYYYAVVTCDSIKTAKSIYDSCDGTEYESTANLFDLRFIPEEMEFNDDVPRDSCSKIPSNYKPEAFVTDALQHSKVKLTWDETPAERVKMSSKAFSQRELDDMDFKAYLASDNSDDEDETEALKNKYKNLVGASSKVANRDIFAKTDDNEDDVDMEITFTPGLDSKDRKQVDENEEREEESTIDKLKRKAKERRQARKDKIKDLKEKEIEEKREAKIKSKNKKKGSSREEDSKSKAELELLMLDEEDNNKSKPQHFDLKELVRSEKEKGKKAKHRNKDRIIEDDFKADLNDPRFKEIFTNHDFAIDPTQPQFKKTSTMNKIMEERNKRRDESEKKQEKSSKKENKKRKLDEDSFDVKSLVQKLKRKAKK